MALTPDGVAFSHPLTPGESVFMGGDLRGQAPRLRNMVQPPQPPHGERASEASGGGQLSLYGPLGLPAVTASNPYIPFRSSQERRADVAHRLNC